MIGDTPRVRALRLQALWLLWAPAVLACKGDPTQERATLARPGIAALRADWDDLMREEALEASQRRERDLLQVLVRRYEIEALGVREAA